MGTSIRTTFCRTITLLILPRTMFSVRGYHAFNQLPQLKLHHPHNRVRRPVIHLQLLLPLHHPCREDDVRNEPTNLELSLGSEEWSRGSTQDFRWVVGIEKDCTTVIGANFARFRGLLVPMIDRQEAFRDADRRWSRSHSARLPFA